MLPVRRTVVDATEKLRLVFAGKVLPTCPRTRPYQGLSVHWLATRVKIPPAWWDEHHDGGCVLGSDPPPLDEQRITQPRPPCLDLGILPLHFHICNTLLSVH